MAAFPFVTEAALVHLTVEDVCAALAAGHFHAIKEWVWFPGSPFLVDGVPSFEVKSCILMVRLGSKAPATVLDHLVAGLGLPPTVTISISVVVDPLLTDEALRVRAVFIW